LVLLDRRDDGNYTAHVLGDASKTIEEGEKTIAQIRIGETFYARPTPKPELLGKIQCALTNDGISEHYDLEPTTLAFHPYLRERFLIEKIGRITRDAPLPNGMVITTSRTPDFQHLN